MRLSVGVILIFPILFYPLDWCFYSLLSFSPDLGFWCLFFFKTMVLGFRLAVFYPILFSWIGSNDGVFPSLLSVWSAAIKVFIRFFSFPWFGFPEMYLVSWDGSSIVVLVRYLLGIWFFWFACYVGDQVPTFFFDFFEERVLFLPFCVWFDWSLIWLIFCHYLIDFLCVDDSFLIFCFNFNSLGNSDSNFNWLSDFCVSFFVYFF